MIETLILDYLTENLSVPVYMEMPADPPASFVLIEKTGSGMENHLKSALIVFQSYADTLYNAATLNEMVKDLMLEAADLPDISASRLNSDYNFTDTDTKKYRYQAVFDIYHY